MADFNLIHEDCDPTLAQDKKLPYTAYIVEYMKEGRLAYDIAIAGSKVELFNAYYDKYKKDFKQFKQTEGRVNPTLWKVPKTLKKPKKIKEES